MILDKKIRPASHVVLLTKIFDLSEGDVAEIGTGYFSTLLLHWLADLYERNVYSFENQTHWFKRALKISSGSPNHKVVFVNTWDELPIEKHWGLIFIDHAPAERRVIEIKKFANIADYIVIHDTGPEDEEKYHYSKVWPLFKYVYHDKKTRPWTSVVSNFKKLKFDDEPKLKSVNIKPQKQPDKTVLYYSADTEDDKLAEFVRQNILKTKGNLPLISVTQKPHPDFGENICVGVHDNCYANEFRQIQVGLEKVKTKYVIVAEADSLYPSDYFRFKPTELGYLYRYDNVWVAFNGSFNYYFKNFSDSSQMLETEKWLTELNKLFIDQKKWFSKKDTVILPPYKRTDPKHIWTGPPVVTFKTGDGVSPLTNYKRNVSPQPSLPYWGSLNKLREEIWQR